MQPPSSTPFKATFFFTQLILNFYTLENAGVCHRSRRLCFCEHN